MKRLQTQIGDATDVKSVKKKIAQGENRILSDLADLGHNLTARSILEGFAQSVVRDFDDDDAADGKRRELGGRSTLFVSATSAAAGRAVLSPKRPLGRILGFTLRLDAYPTRSGAHNRKESISGAAGYQPHERDRDHAYGYYRGFHHLTLSRRAADDDGAVAPVRYEAGDH